MCFTSSGDHSEDKGEECGGGGEVFHLDRDTQAEAEDAREHFILHLSRKIDSFLIFFTLRVKLPPVSERSAEVKAAQRLFVFIRLT